MNSAQTVLVIGAQGFLGSTIANLFARKGWQVLRGSRQSDHTPGTVLLDLDKPDTVAAAIDGVDLIINTVPHPGMLAEKLVLQRGGRLLNVATIDARQDRRTHNAASTDPRGTVVLNAGLAPGVTNLVAAHLLKDHPEAETIEVVLSLSTKGMSGPAGVRFAHTNITHADRQHPSRTRKRTALIPLPSPIGNRQCFALGDTEDGGVGNLTLGPVVNSYAYFGQQALHTSVLVLSKFRWISRLPLWPLMIGHSNPPRTPSREPVMHWVSVLKNGTRLAASTIHCQGDYLHTAAATLVMADALLDAGTPAGCFSPEDLGSLTAMRETLAENGISISQVATTG